MSLDRGRHCPHLRRISQSAGVIRWTGSDALNEQRVTAAARVYRDGRHARRGRGGIEPGFRRSGGVTAANGQRRQRQRPSCRQRRCSGTERCRKTKNGQCQRYQEYESVPSVCSGAESSTTPAPRCGCSAPATRTAIVPITGNRGRPSRENSESPRNGVSRAQNREDAEPSQSSPATGRQLSACPRGSMTCQPADAELPGPC